MNWDQEKIHGLVEDQREYFLTGATLDVEWRIAQLKKLRDAIKRRENALLEALYKDIGRSNVESYLVDIGSTILEINETIKGLRKWQRSETHFSGLLLFPSTITKVYKMPYGVSYIISPFNFPILLTIGVLTAAIAGGNTAVVRASSKSPNCTREMQSMLADIFPREYVSVVDGGHDVADMLLEERFDKIFYTGSPKVGTHVMEKAAKHLTPVALELGGETGNWCIIRKDADIRDAARKIAFFKMLNSGQICIEINQVAVAEEVAEEFIEALKSEFDRQIGNALTNPEYPHMIGKTAYDKCADEANEYRDRIVYGGHGDPASLKYEPTIIYPVDIDEPIVNHELFCPLLPIVTYPDSEIDGLLDTVARREHGLALYLFTRDIDWAKRTMSSQQYGSGCINEVCVQLMVKGAPFNGTGHSGMGAYHGEWGFREFTHPSTVLIGRNKFNLSVREHPFGGKAGRVKSGLIRLLER